MTLVMAMGILGVLTFSGATLIYYSSANSRSAEYSNDNTGAYHLAEAGLNEMLAVLNNVNNPLDPNLLPTTTSTYDGGTATWSGTLDTASWKWSLSSIGLIKNPTGPATANVRRTLTAVVPIYPRNTQPLAVNAWNYVFSTGTGDPDGCDMLVASGVDVKTRLMAAGNICWANNAKQTAGELMVGGTNTVNGSAFVGTSAEPIIRVDVDDGCRVGTGTIHDPCQGPPANADKVWATTITSDPAGLVAPTTDLDGWYANASPGPHNACQTVSGTPPVFENETSPKLRNRSVTGSFNLTPTSSYTCQTFGGGHPLGELSWNNTTKVLTVLGTIFIDGNALINQDGTYQGQATLYLSGSFLLNQAKFCPVKSGGSCDYTTGAWDPNEHLLTIVANGAGGQTGVSNTDSISMNGTSEWQGALYGGAYIARMNSGVKSSGPIIADEVSLNSSVQQQGFSTIGEAPTGMPGNPVIVAQPDSPELYSG
jgi:hypothetical protein